MKRIILIIVCISLIMLSACNAKVVSKETNESTPNTAVISNQSTITNGEKIILRSGELGDYYDISENMFLGYDGIENIYYYGYSNNMVQKANINSYETNNVLSIKPIQGNYVMAVIMESPWIIWSESQDKDLYVGKSTGPNWALRAMNIETKEIITIDSENEFFPKKRDFNPQPIEFCCKNNIFTFNGYIANEKGIFKAIKYFDFETRKLKTIATLEKSNKGYSCPSAGDKYISFSESLFEDGELKNNIIYLYDIHNEKLKLIDNPENLCSPEISGKYIIATQKWQNSKQEESIYIYDIDTNKWVDTINKNSIIYDNSMSQSIKNIEAFGDYMAWEATEDRILYLYNIKENKFYKLLDKEDNRYIGYISHPFKNNMFAWVDDTVDFSDPKYKFVIIK